MSSWYERSGGYLVAIFLHILLISWLAAYVQLRAETVTSSGGVEIELVAEAAAPADPAESVTQAPPPPPEDAARTGDEEDAAEMAEQLESMLVAMQEALEAQKESEQVPVEVAKATIPEPEPTPKPEPTQRPLTKEEIEQAKLEEAYKQYSKAVASSSQNRNSIKDAIQKEEMKVKGSELLSEVTSGADTGAVRQFNLQGSPEVVQEIMDRYRLRNVTRFVKGNGMEYLNKIDTNSGDPYYSKAVEGRKEVIEYGTEMTRKLVQLEKQAMIERGFDPRRDRVLLIVFGIVQTEHGWDLGVIDMKAEKIE